MTRHEDDYPICDVCDGSGKVDGGDCVICGGTGLLGLEPMRDVEGYVEVERE